MTSDQSLITVRLKYSVHISSMLLHGNLRLGHFKRKELATHAYDLIEITNSRLSVVILMETWPDMT